MRDGYICEYQGVNVETLSDAELIVIAAILGFDKDYDLETLTREELIDLFWANSWDYDNIHI